MIYEPVLIATHFKKIVGFLDDFRWGFMVRTLSVNQLPLGIKTLTPEAIQALVFGEIDIARIINSLQHLLHYGDMGAIGGADESRVIDAKFGPQLAKKPANGVHVYPGRQIFLFGGTYDFITMLIGAG